MFDNRRQHVKIVRRLEKLRLPGPIGGGLLDWYAMALQRWAPEQDALTYFGASIRCNPVDSIQLKILLFGIWEPGVSRVIEDNLRPGDVFVDIGANIGYDSLLSANRVGVDGGVVAIEASPRIFGLLQRNLDRNPLLARRVRAVNIAASDHPGVVDLYDFGPGNIGATTTLASRQGTRCATVAAARLGDIVTCAETGRMRLVKMDVEGAEPAILKDILAHLETYPVDMDLIVEANPEDDPGGFREVFERLLAAGFTAWAIDNGYSNGWYLRWRAARLRRMTRAPVTRQDLFLTRRQEL